MDKRLEIGTQGGSINGVIHPSGEGPNQGVVAGVNPEGEVSARECGDRADQRSAEHAGSGARVPGYKHQLHHSQALRLAISTLCASVVFRGKWAKR